MELAIYTDGGCSGNPGPGGWAFVILKVETRARASRGFTAAQPEVLMEKKGAEKDTTNNRMELMAVISALESLKRIEAKEAKNGPVKLDRISLYTDSQYVQLGITSWIESWKARNWKTSDKTPVKNQELWERLDNLAAQFPIKWIWVKGHAGNEWNERCDELTQRAIAALK